MTTPQTARTMALIAAAQARIEGMKATNTERESNGLSLAYDAEAFFAEASSFVELAHEVIQQ
ncbi:MAG: hypothetical protein WAN92_09135 [Herbaspirillum sp.]